jgi:NAD(P)-dependent dehydrogenase (short-subunit alcohol dehydrogenase family)
VPDHNLALVTGASRGIGRALVLDLVDRGWDVAALARDSEALAELAGRFPGRVIPVVADVTDPVGMRAALGALREARETFDLVVANAGVLGAVGPTWTVDPHVWWREFEVNVRGVDLTLREVLPAMVARRSGRVIVMSSGMGRAPSPFSSAYGSSKAAVTHLVGSLAAELAGTGVCIFAISPGMVRTDMTEWPPGLLAHRPELAELPDSAFHSVSAAAGLVADLASGRFDALSGRFIHVREDREALLDR